MAGISIIDDDDLEELMASSIISSISDAEDDDEDLDCNVLDFIPPERAAEDEKELAKEMQQSSLGERQEALFDIHGVAKVVEETDESIRNSLAELEVFIEANKNTQYGASYRTRLLNINPHQITSKTKRSA
jgi:predicted DNA-binding ArsR family transcriptional regulator